MAAPVFWIIYFNLLLNINKIIMVYYRSMRGLRAAIQSTLAARSKTEIGAKPSQVLRSCRLQFQNPATFEITAVYLTRTDARRYRVKVFKGGKCQLAEYIEGDDFLDVFAKIEKKLYEN